ncbi:hypothetical protein G6F57_000643 [Rhizopus arrhizus]|jgi:PAS domain S-box-containing protein|uniref:PAS domain-containing protein n=1 Tax=Rhizopus oryzae TaxID=64495 RepID=A0A9P6XJT3_RHIOR|nr:hypothetical protein G6F23_012897 [Rhizopus arrhizus]KAG0762036.1 hypothetical protein G6F24_007113 [Rhizopus arrhizus]KAG0788487.1 hypothetical protein G6F21_007185 [Rhizopus arrhizus]KAG0798675.1 hypothetical protein G6F22_003985 [Rhizopus arrhizus]KAG0819818.1 hypothetical protein G6F20_000450 [Rhizopus arrhizus]
MRNSWITIYCNTPSAKIIFASDTITDSCGWEPEEVIGRQGSQFVHPEDQKSLLKTHTVNIVKERMASMVCYRFLRKDGTYVTLESVINYCYDLLISSNYIYDENTLEHRMRRNTVDEVFVCHPTGRLQLAGAWNEQTENIIRIIETSEIWQGDKLLQPLEKRFCLILNRFAEALPIVYASHCIEDLVSLPVPEVIGQSFFNFISERDIPAFRAQINMAKQHGSVVRLRFDWQMGKGHYVSEPVEGTISSTNDGIVLVMRLSPRLIMKKS